LGFAAPERNKMSNKKKIKVVLTDTFDFRQLDAELEEEYQKFLTSEKLEDSSMVRSGFIMALVQEIADTRDMDRELQVALLEHYKEQAKAFMGQAIRGAVQAVFNERAN
jgi:predicted house-cleaning noncanonical NTP pyrophosphatase (MazG superfamily)